MGLHPTSVGEDWEKELQFVFDQVENGGYVAIGEIGMDGYWSKEFIGQQKEVFAQQLKLAYRKGLPVIIHAREATDEIFEVLDSLKGEVPKGVFHAFSGSYETYGRICSYGDFMVGIGGVVTYKNAGVAKSVEKIPLDRIILETDSPYLTPVPMRGKRNDSSYLVYIAEKIAQVKGITLEEVAEATTANAFKMFGL
jgi:TatD DNase family protein